MASLKSKKFIRAIVFIENIEGFYKFSISRASKVLEIFPMYTVKGSLDVDVVDY